MQPCPAELDGGDDRDCKCGAALGNASIDGLLASLERALTGDKP